LSDLKQLLAESKSLPSAFRKDHPIGTVWAGVVQSVEVRQVRDDDGNVETWDNGDPKQQVVVAIKTDQRDPERPNDDGVRGIYIKWWKEQRKALRECLEAAGVDDIEPGGLFAAKYVGDGAQPQNKMLSPAKLMQYEYKPPSPTAGLFGSSNGNGAPPATPTAPPAPAQAAAAAPPPAQPPVQPPAPATDPWTAAPTADPWSAFTSTPAAPVAAPAAPPPPPPAAPAAPMVAEVVNTPPAAPAAADPMALLATIKALLATGMTDEQIAGVTGTPAQAITAIRQLPS